MYGTKRSFLLLSISALIVLHCNLFFLFDLPGYMGFSMTNAQMLFWNRPICKDRPEGWNHSPMEERMALENWLLIHLYNLDIILIFIYFDTLLVLWTSYLHGGLGALRSSQWICRATNSSQMEPGASRWRSDLSPTEIVGVTLQQLLCIALHRWV